jgi:hypothetical protein
VLLALCAGPFLLALDGSVMTVAIATVAEGLGTTITAIRSAIVLSAPGPRSGPPGGRSPRDRRRCAPARLVPT